MRRFLLYYIMIFLWQTNKAQNFAFVQFDSLAKTAELKWYTKNLISTSGMSIYRKEGTNDWAKLNSETISFGKNKIQPALLAKDSALHAVYLLSQDPHQLKSLTLLAVLLKSFESRELSEYLGIDFTDREVQIGKKYFYKIVESQSTLQNSFAECSLDLSRRILPDEAPKNIHYKIEKGTVHFSCLPETNRYYGIRVFRTNVDSINEVLLTPHPLLMSSSEGNSKKENLQVFYQDQTTTEGSTYFYRFQAFNFFNVGSTLSQAIKVNIPDKTAPSAPDSCMAKVAGRSITYVWSKNKTERDLLGFNIYRTNKNDTDYQKINKDIISKEMRSFTDSVSSFQSYLFKISAVDQSGNEKSSSEKQIEVYDNEPPLIPQKIQIVGDSGKITITWKKNQEKDLWGYLIYRSISDTSSVSFVKITPQPIRDNIYEDLLPGNAKNRFLYRIVAIDLTYNRSPYSSFVSARMTDLQPPSRPFITGANFHEEAFYLEWLANPEKDLTGYFLEKLYSDENGQQKIQIKLSPDLTSFKDSKIKSGQTYTYHLVAIDSSGNKSQSSNKYMVKTPTVDNPKKTKLTLKIKQDKRENLLTLKWENNSSEKLIGYVVYKRSEFESALSPATGKLKAIFFKETQFEINQTYYYQVRAYMNDGSIVYSEILKIKPKPIK